MHVRKLHTNFPLRRSLLDYDGALRGNVDLQELIRHGLTSGDRRLIAESSAHPISPWVASKKSILNNLDGSIPGPIIRLGKYWELVGDGIPDSKPSGGRMLVIRPRPDFQGIDITRFPGATVGGTTPEGTLWVLFQYPAMAEILDAELHADGTVILPDATASNWRLEQAGFCFRFWNSQGQVEDDEYVSHLSKPIPEYPYDLGVQFFLHDGWGTHGPTLLVVHPKVHLQIAAMANFLQKQEIENPDKIVLIQEKKRELVQGIDGQSNRIDIALRRVSPSIKGILQNVFENLVRMRRFSEAALIPEQYRLYTESEISERHITTDDAEMLATEMCKQFGLPTTFGSHVGYESTA